MDLAKARGDVIMNEHVSSRHRLFRGKCLPRVRTKMVAAKKHTNSRQANALGNAINKVTETDRLHSSVAALLIDLVRGCFDQSERRTRAAGMEQRRFDHERMRGAYRESSASLARPVPRDQVEKG